MKIIHGDSLEVLKTLPDNSVDSIVSDPPYGISFMGKKWDYDVPSVDVWKECMRVLKPGGHALIACGTRTQHRMAVNLEDAGFEIRDVVAWVYGSGFPKSLNIGKAVDKLQGNERELIRYDKNSAPDLRDVGAMSKENSGIDKLSFGQNHRPAVRKQVEITKGNSPYEGWGTALKPAMELWTLCRKPLEEKTVAKNVLKYGTGGINIDECRVEHNEPVKTTNRQKDNGDTWDSSNTGLRNNPGTIASADQKGRFPANLIHDGSEEVVSEFPESKSGARKKGFSNKKSGYEASSYEMRVEWDKDIPAEKGSASRFFMACKYTPNDAIMKLCENNINANNAEISLPITNLIEGVVNISSVLKNAPLNLDLLNQNLNALFAEKIPKNTVIDFVAKLVAIKEVPEGVLSQQELTATQDFITNYKNSTQTQNNVGAEKLENTDITQITINLLKLCGYVLLVIEENTNSENHKKSGNNEPKRFLYQAKASKSERNKGLEGFEEKENQQKHRFDRGDKSFNGKASANNHPTVKPVKLMQYLCRLITPKGGTVLDPYTGSGTTGIGAKLEGFDFIGIEREEDYVKIAEARIDAWKPENTLKLDIE